MNLLMILYIVALFTALTPGILLRLPTGGSKIKVAAFHAVVFAVVFYLTAKAVSRITVSEGFQGGPDSPINLLQNAQRQFLDMAQRNKQSINDLNTTLSDNGKKIMVPLYNSMKKTNEDLVIDIQKLIEKHINQINQVPDTYTKLSKSDKAAMGPSIPKQPIPPAPANPSNMASGAVGPPSLAPGFGPGPRPGPN
jgi:hypothetical protein